MSGVYTGALIDAARDIRLFYPNCGYDPAPYYPPSGPLDPLHIEQADLFARGYAGFKYTVASVLQPRRIVEVGVGACVSAMAFLNACGQAHYLGIDSGMHRPGILAEARTLLAGFDAQILEVDSRTLTALPGCDLAHVDGGHSYELCCHDVGLAIRAAEWVLVDDARDSQVAAAALRAVYDWRPGDMDWTVFEDTWTGSILVHTKCNERRAAT